MNVTRRQLLIGGAATLAAAALTGCESLEQRFTHPELPDDAFTPVAQAASPIHRLLDRATFGPKPGEIADAARQGIEGWVDQQLNPAAIAESQLLNLRLRPLDDVLTTDTGLLFDTDDRRLVAALRQATTLRAVYSHRQLYERTVEFWSDHFNIYAFKGQGPQLKVVDDRTTVRAHALGSFRDLLGASARSAAMLGYLDNNVNRKGVPNENYAREIMELHTLGVHGGYTQDDVRNVARCLTGWTAEKHWHRGRFLFDASAHDIGRKIVLGQVIPPGGGLADGERVLDIIANHPSTSMHIATKMCRYFLGDAPKTLVDDVAATYRRTSGQIKPMVRQILTSQDLLIAPPIFKRPFDYLVSGLRALNADTDGGSGVQARLETMGQPLFAWPMPNGYPTDTRSWIGGLIPRWNAASDLVFGRIESTSVDLKEISRAARHANLDTREALIELTHGDRFSNAANALRANLTSVSGDREYAALALMSPAFQWR